MEHDHIPGNSSPHHRRSVRLAEYDYSLPGAYFVTLVTQGREWVLGVMDGGNVCLTPAGETAQDLWQEIPGHFQNVSLDEFVIMPNHMHGIIVINDGRGTACVNGRGTACRAPTKTEQFGKPVPGSIATIVRSFKSAVSKRINEQRSTPGAPVWQRNYYEHIIRDENDLNRIRQYILENPMRWGEDDEYML